MLIKGTKILVLGGWGLVGSAICRKLMEHSPAEIIVSSLRKEEAEDAVEQLRKEYPTSNHRMFTAHWGNIFTRSEWKDYDWSKILSETEARKQILGDVFDELDDKILRNSALYHLICEKNPDIVIDCINTATAIAYQDIYKTANSVRRLINRNETDNSIIEKMLSSVYIPQLIRHIQILYRGLIDGGTKLYLKIGTSGTGGMGLNIPYTHSEERPSRVLLAKAAVAGAQSLLLFLMARTPDGPFIKEIKPTAAIAWKRIAYGKVLRKGKPIPLVDMEINDARNIGAKFNFNDYQNIKSLGSDYEAVFIDTGENGIFSKGEFQAISSLGQMEIVTPEDIAEYAVFEILGGNTGKDIIQGLDSFSLGPTYRGGYLQQSAMRMLENLEKEHKSESIAFELLGPPRLSKLLYEAHIINRIAGSMKNIFNIVPEDFSKEAVKLLESNSMLRSQMLSIGLVVLLPDGKKYLRGKEVKIPASIGDNEIELSEELINKWCHEAWIDLRTENFKNWKVRIDTIIKQSEKIPEYDTSSRYTFTKEYWNNFERIDEGKIVGWIFEFEDKGWRFKH